MHKVDKGCRFAIVTHDTIKEKIKEQLGKATKRKREPTSRLTNKIQKKHFKLRRENKFKNKKKHSCVSHCIHNRYSTLWNFIIFSRYHSADTQQKPTQNQKLKLLKLEHGKLNYMKYKFHMISISMNTHRKSNWRNPAAIK